MANRIRSVILNILNERQHFIWVGLNQIVCRFLIAFKFLFIATLLGPEAIGLAGVGLLILAVVEALTDTGLPQAVVQAPDQPTTEALSGVWIVQSVRGLVLSIALFLLASPVESFFKIDGSAEVIFFAAFCPILRNSISTKYHIQQRNRNFRFIACTEVSCLSLDLVVTYLLYLNGQHALSLIFGSIAADFLRLIVSWIRPVEVRRPDWKAVKSLKQFGFWIWVNSIIMLIINQYDKVVVAKMLGVVNFGSYQMASKAGQLAFGDIALGIAQFVFPTISRLNTEDAARARAYFFKILFYTVGVFFIIGILSYVFLTQAPKTVIPEKWLRPYSIMTYMLPLLIAGALNGILSSYIRAIGRPKIVTGATLIQASIFIPCAYYFCLQYGVIGIVLINTVAMSSATAYMLFAIVRKNEKYEVRGQF